MESTRSLLGHAAQERQSTDPDAAKALNRAVRLLNEEVALRDLLAMYRSVLYQG
jgi:type III secretion protein X